MAPEGDSYDETNRYLDEMVTLACDLQRQTGMRPLYYSADLFSHPRYMNGAGANPDAHVFAYACAQVKRAMDAAKRLDAENFVFFNPRDGYQSVLQRQFFRDMSHMAQLYRMAVQYKDKIGFRGQLLIQPKPADPRRHQYEADAMATMYMLRHFNLDKQYKLYIKPAFSRLMGRTYEHDVYMAAAFNMLGCVDASDSFPEFSGTSDTCAQDIRDATFVMKCVLEQVTTSANIAIFTFCILILIYENTSFRNIYIFSFFVQPYALISSLTPLFPRAATGRSPAGWLLPGRPRAPRVRRAS